ncbi:MAG: amidohydrolase family protein, partial [Candidatus Bipolaricaulota bacterium]
MNDRVLFENGNLITMDQQLPLAHNVLVEGSTIRALNVEKESLNRDVEIYDLKGETVIPGLNDSHLHMVSYGISLDMVDLNDAESVKEVKQRVGEYIQSDGVEEGEWIFGRGWNEENFKGKKDLSKDDLDEISTKHPIVLTRTCGH